MTRTSVQRASRAATAALVAALIAGCGGGGDDTPAPAATYNVQAAFANLAAAARGFALLGTATNGSPLNLNWTITPMGASVFPLTGAPSRRVDSAVVVRSTTTELVNGSQQSHFDAAMAGLGSVRPDGSCTRSDNPALPTAAALLGSGKLGDSTIFATCSTAATVIGSLSGTWTLEPINGLVYLCANTEQKDAGGATVSRESDCVEVAPDGSIGTHARITLIIGGAVIVFSN